MAATRDKHGGRVERRVLQATTMLDGYLDWPGVAQGGRLERTVLDGGAATVEVEYLICSGPRERAGAAVLLGWARGHWGIENRLHWVRDVTLGEDAHRARSGSAPQALAALRNLAISKPRLDGAANIAAALRRNAARVRDLLVSLCILYASQEFYAHWLMYGALQIEPTNSGCRHTARQALSAASSNAAASRYTRNDQ